jgi:hypothetical protein
LGSVTEKAADPTAGAGHRYPIMPTSFIFQLKSGLTSAPHLPQKPGFNVRYPTLVNAHFKKISAVAKSQPARALYESFTNIRRQSRELMV